MHEALLTPRLTCDAVCVWNVFGAHTGVASSERLSGCSEGSRFVYARVLLIHLSGS